MGKKKKKSEPMAASDVILYLFRIMVSTYCCILFVAMPLIYHNKYYDIGDFKFKMFMYITVSFLMFAFFMLAVYILVLALEKKITVRAVISMFKSLSVLDWFMIAFALASTLSFILSPLRSDEFPVFFLFRGGMEYTIINLPWEGYKGWNMGLRSQLIFVALYFFTSRLFMKSWRVDLHFFMLASAFMAFLFGVLHRFNIDPLGLYENLQDIHRLKFLSTLGQSSWYSSYMVLLLPVGMAFYLFSDRNNNFIRILLGFFAAAGGATFVTQNSDSAYMAFFAILTVMFAVSFESNDIFLNFLEMMIIMLASMKFIGILQMLFPQRVPELDKLSFFVSKSITTWILLLILIAFYIFIYKITGSKKFEITSYKKIRNIILFVLIAALPIGMIIGYLNTKGLLPTSALSNVEYLTFNDYWGNNRGLTWRNTIEVMMEPLWRSMMLTGPGPDCYVTVMYALEPRATDLRNFWAGEMVICCHNEWLNMLFNEGILGFISYMGIFVSAFVLFIKKCDNAVMTAGVAAILGYFFHNMFCYQQILCTPIIFCIIGLCEWARRNPSNIA